MCRSMLLLVRFVSKQNLNIAKVLENCNPYQSLFRLEPPSVWTSSKVCPNLKGMTQYWLWLINSPNLRSLFPFHIPSQLCKLPHSFIKNVYDIFGMPQVIISDRDKIFTSALWQELFKLADVKLNMSSSYHPQTDGQTERLNQCLEAYLRCAVHSCPKH